ncbi:TPA: site-specific DNA-methyltransferase [Acinetobacter baumannii]|nr:site-specific DNA-methyltransferase [Acinetobacter baumannii]HAV4560653.1 site-specific DNA-methyltransferase [Acinetobacter baumannii]HAV4584099.1 site-specific DNA-methyltransferase [Acinetobacter baumannii]
MDTALIQTINGILKQFPKFWNGKNLQRSLVIDAIQKKEVDLVKALISNDKIKSIYSTDVDGILIFDFDKLISLLKYKEYWADSFTKYRNKVGLTSSGKYLDYNSDVILDFPFKDCILEGGMRREDHGKDEIYYNEIIARDEIDRLFSPKVLTNSKRYTKDGIEENINNFNNDDNLIIKGNNLIALTTIMNRYKGLVKCIYIDPPYNTRTDANTFVYNNNFNHSTWLTFMKNRLEQAKELLADDGVIFIDIDHYELFYLGVLADEIFGYENRIGVLSVVHNLKGRFNEFFSTAHENKIVYAKDASKVCIKEFTHDNSHNYPLEDDISRYKLINLQRTGDGSKREDRPNLYYSIWFNPNNGEISLENKEGFVEILPIDNEGVDRRWRWGRDKVENEWKTEIVVKEKDGVFKIYTKLRIKGEKPKSIWLKPEYSGTTGTNELKKLLGDKVFSYPKSVELVKDSIQIVTEPDDIILDYHAGSGTTGQAVLELNQQDNGNRKFILIEQMDYVQSVTAERINQFIKRENLDSNFVYTELMELNYLFIHKIEKAETTEDLIQLFELMKTEAHLNYDIALDQVLNNEYEIDGVDHFVSFSELELTQQKQLLIEILDKNQLYVNFSEMDDQRFTISESDKAFTNSFYQKD